jgi:flotillin
MNVIMLVGAVIASVIVVGGITAALFRVVVETNKVFIVQRKKSTTSYGKGKESGNVFYKWPAWFPMIGVSTIELPVSNFDLSLSNYEAYDQDRVPFVIDVTAFFRIDNTNVAAQRVSTTAELNDQLIQIIQGAVRTILASHSIDDIMMKRETFGNAFTKAVAPELEGWGVIPVKNLELMDIRDAKESQVIHNIMAKKKSHIEMESRLEVAENGRAAQEGEIQAQQQVQLKAVDAERIVGEKTAEKDKTVGIANEKQKQDVAEEAAITAEKDMGVVRVNTVRKAEIDREQSEINLGEAEFQAAAVLKQGEAEAEVRTKIFKADSALEIRLKYQMDTSVGVARELAQGDIDLVPEIFIGGGGTGAEGGSTAVETLTKLMTVGLAQGQLPGQASLEEEVVAAPAAVADLAPTGRGRRQ